MGIDEYSSVFELVDGVSRQMDFLYQPTRDVVKKYSRIKVMVDGVDIYIVHIQKDAAPGLFRNLGHEFPLRHG